MRITLALLVGLYGLLASPTGASESRSRAQAVDVAATRLHHFRRGVNVNHWFYAVCGGRWNTDNHVTPAQMRGLRAQGVDHVRLSVDLALLVRVDEKAGPVSEGLLTALQRSVSAFTTADLGVIVSLRSQRPAGFLGKTVSVAALTGAWQLLAARLSSTNPELVLFEPINNPAYDNDGEWQQALETLVGAIRAAAPRHTIVAVSADTWAHERLLSLKPLKHGNVAYAFHFKAPRVFVDQGAPYAPSSFPSLRMVPYPLTVESTRAFLATLPEGKERRAVASAAREEWDGARVRRSIGALAAWGARHRVPLLCVEFWVYKPNTTATARLAWLRDVRTALESYGIGWCVWEHLLAPRGLKLAYVDPEDVGALGLKADQRLTH